MIGDHQIVIDGLGNANHAQGWILSLGELSQHPRRSHRAVASGVEEAIDAPSSKVGQQPLGCGVAEIHAARPNRRAGSGAQSPDLLRARARQVDPIASNEALHPETRTEQGAVASFSPRVDDSGKAGVQDCGRASAMNN